MADILASIRKELPPPTRTHTSRKDYRRKPKHPGREFNELQSQYTLVP